MIRLASVSFSSPAGGGQRLRGWGARLPRLDLSLILSPFVYCVWGPRGRSLPPLPLPSFSGALLSRRGDRIAFCSPGPRLSAEPQPPHRSRVQTPGPSRVPALCLVADSCLSSRLFQFACHLHTFHFSFLTPAAGREWGGGDLEEGGALLLCSAGDSDMWRADWELGGDGSWESSAAPLS